MEDYLHIGENEGTVWVMVPVLGQSSFPAFPLASVVFVKISGVLNGDSDRHTQPL
jgi:hypothetical protein